MYAIEDHGRLTWSEVPRPEMGPTDVRIRVHATAVNRADLVQRAGHYPPPPGASPILGLECAGVIEAIGEGVTEREVGEEVVALLAGGGYAEQVVCPAAHTATLPPGLDLTRAAAVMEVFATAWLNLRREGELVEGERVLLHAGASGVGTAAIQLCAAWGNPVFATVGSQVKRTRCMALGASGTANRHDGSWVEPVKQWGSPDVILDPVGGAYLQDNLRVLNRRGRLVLIGLLGGREATLPLGLLLVKRQTVRGSVLRSRSHDEKAAVVAGLQREVWPLFARGEVEPVIHTVMDIRDAEQAHDLIRGNETIGKVILAID